MDWRRSRRLIPLATALLLAGSLSIPPAAVQSADGADESHVFSAEERDGLCREFEQGGLSFYNEDGYDDNVLRCHLEGGEWPSGYVGRVIIELYESDEAARNKWRHKSQRDGGLREEDEYSYSSSGKLGHSHTLFLRHENSNITVEVSGLSKADSGLVESLKRTAMSIVDGRAPARKPDATITLEHWPPTTVTTTSQPKPGGVPGDLIATVTDAQGRGIAGRQVFLYVEPGANLEKAMILGTLTDPALWEVGSINWNNSLKGLTDNEGRLTTNYLTSGAIDGLHQAPGGGLVPAFADTLNKDGKIEGRVTAVVLDRNYASGTGMSPPTSIVATATVPMEFTHVAVIRQVKSRDLAAPAKISVMSTDLLTGAEKGTDLVGPKDVPYDLKPGDVILLDRNDAIEMEWLSGIRWRVQTRAKVVGDKFGTLTIGFRDAGWYHWIKETLTGKWAHGANIGGGVIGHIALGPKAWAKAVGHAVFALTWEASAAYNEAVMVEPMSSILFDAAEDMTFYTIEGTARLHSRRNAGTTDVTTGHMMAVAPDGSFGAISQFDVADLDEDLTSLLDWAPAEGPSAAMIPAGSASHVSAQAPESGSWVSGSLSD